MFDSLPPQVVDQVISFLVTFLGIALTIWALK